MRTIISFILFSFSISSVAQISFDKYFTGKVLRFDFMLSGNSQKTVVYPLNVEPWEPNITTMMNFESKWKKMIGKDIPVPTPSEEKYRNITGLFEGGGYSAKGIYRSEMECRMKINSPKGFCSVCRNAIKEMIEFYIK